MKNLFTHIVYICIHFSSKRVILLSLIHLIIPIKLLAQGKFVEGYIINSKNDTIHGSIRDENWAESPRRIQFKILNAAPQTISAQDIRGFGVIPAREIYKSRKIGLLNITLNQTYRYSPSLETDDSVQVFLQELVAGGKVALFEFTDASEHSHFFLEKSDSLKELYNYPFYKLIGGQTYLLLYDKYKEQLARFCGDADRFRDSPPLYQEKYLKRYIERYNRSFLTDNVSYSAKDDRLTCDLEANICLENWKGRSFAAQYKPTCGVGIRLNFPRRFHNRYTKISFLLTPNVPLGFYPDPIRKRVLKTFEVAVGTHLGAGKTRPYFGFCGSAVHRGYRMDILGLQAGISYNRRVNLEMGNFCNFYTFITKTGFFLPPRISLQCYIPLDGVLDRIL